MADKVKQNVKDLSPKELYQEYMPSYLEHWDNDASLYENVLNLVNSCVYLPNKSLYAPIAATYILMSSKWSKVCPVLFSWGDKGSGKSTLSMLANVIHGKKSTFSPTDTFASIRNALDVMRWVDPYNKLLEREGAILAWDNIHIKTLENDPKIYQLLLFGYNRSTDKISIAAPDGTNKDFNVYCPKIISSIDPIHIVPELNELQRRLLIIPHKPWEKFTAEEKLEYEGVDIQHDLIDLDSVNWEGLSDRYYMFWADEMNCRTYVSWRSVLGKKGKKPFKLPSGITSSQWAVTIDLATTMMTLGVFSELQQCIDFLGEYWRVINNSVLNEHSAIIGHLQAFIQEETKLLRESNQRLIQAGQRPMPLLISPKKLKDRIAFHSANGELEVNPRSRDVSAYMWELGYKLTVKGWIER